MLGLKEWSIAPGVSRCLWQLIFCGGLLSVPNSTGACGAQQVASGKSTFLLPAGVAYDAAGDLFIADTLKNQIIEVSLAGVTSVTAGTGEQGFAGDGGPASSALLNRPTSVAVGTDGTLFIADAGNQRIRAVLSGKIQTVAGNGAKGFSGDGGDALLAKLDTPLALAIEAKGALLIADSGNHRVRRLAAGVLTTVAGSGVQGFGGDGGPSVAAQLDTPAGVAVAGDGRIFVADSHNHRLRVIGTDGIISTFAGNGVRGFGGDGSAAASAMLYLPRGVTVTPAGTVIFADSDNHRLRAVDANGTIATIAGDGVQGGFVNGLRATGASLDSPRGVALSSFAAPVFADARNRVTSEIAGDNALYAIGGTSTRAASVTLAALQPLTYGQGAMTITVTSLDPVPQGLAALLDGGVAVATATLANGSATLATDGLAAGTHALVGAFGGDGLHGAATGPATIVTVAPLAATASAQPVTMNYGDRMPPLSGTISGLLTRDAGNITASFSTNAPDLAPVGTYPITATLAGSGSGNYTVTLSSSSGALHVVPTAATLVMAVPQLAYAGLSLTLTASLTSTTRGTPTGTINFLDGGAVVATAIANGGLATAVYSTVTPGAHVLTASYAGDHNFLAATSAPASITVSPMPDFAVTSNTTAQTVQGGSIAAYALQVAPQSGPFAGSITFSASGLPPGATAAFTPAAVVPGGNVVAVTMNIQTMALGSAKPPALFPKTILWLGLLSPVLAIRRARKKVRQSVATFAVLLLCAGSGCGTRTAATHTGITFPIVVTATSTNLAGSVVTHTVGVTLTVD